MITRKQLMNLLCIYGLISLLIFVVQPARADRFYDETGKYQGRIQDNGRIYDERGRYQGRIERDRVYDDKGKYRGRLKSSGVFDDNDEYTGASVRSENYYRMHKGYFPEEYE